jgi:hypothetical protein
MRAESKSPPNELMHHSTRREGGGVTGCSWRSIPISSLKGMVRSDGFGNEITACEI